MIFVTLKCQECGDDFKASPNSKGGKLPRFCTTCRYRRSTMARPFIPQHERRKRSRDETGPRSQP